jgi:thioredoxin reductase (NADPH)
MLCRGESLEKSKGSGMARYLIGQLEAKPNFDVLYRTEVVAARGTESLEAIDVRNSETGETTRLESGGLFLFIGADAETAWLPREIALDDHGYVLTGPDLEAHADWRLERDPYLLETSVPGIFACGDVRSGPVKRVASAVGEGSLAIAFVQRFVMDAESEAVTRTPARATEIR